MRNKIDHADFSHWVKRQKNQLIQGSLFIGHSSTEAQILRLEFDFLPEQRVWKISKFCLILFYWVMAFLGTA
jgi:hypothetical protein